MKQVEITITIFSIINQEIKILLIKKQSDPYKGYWMIPKINADFKQSIDDSVKEIITKLNLKGVNLFQSKTISDMEREEGLNYINIAYIGIIDSVRVQIGDSESVYEKEWFAIDKIPKTAYNYQKIIENNICYLREIMKKASTLNLFFPSDFSLPEMQSAVEKISFKKFDRRNFRKKIIEANIVEEMEEKQENGLGRPPKLYMFKEVYKDIDIY